MHRNKQGLEGRYQDQIKDGNGKIFWQSAWSSNLVVESCNLLLSAMMKREEGISGILYWAVGEGESTWDTRSPSPAPSDTCLVREVSRKALATHEIIYLNTRNEPSESPTSRLQITASFSGADFGLEGQGIQSLREFGLFGGEATTVANSGLMIDTVIHPRIDLSAEMTLRRNLHLSFAANRPMETAGGFGARLPVIAIDGVGEQFSAALRRQNVRTLSDLLRLDPLQGVGRIQAVNLREFRAKARMVMAVRFDMRPFMPLAESTISALLKTPPQALAKLIEDAEVSGDSLARLQEELAILQVALDESALQNITLGDLLIS